MTRMLDMTHRQNYQKYYNVNEITKLMKNGKLKFAFSFKSESARTPSEVKVYADEKLTFQKVY